MIYAMLVQFGYKYLKAKELLFIKYLLKNKSLKYLKIRR